MGDHPRGWHLAVWLTAALSAVPQIPIVMAVMIAVAVAHESTTAVGPWLAATWTAPPASFAAFVIYRYLGRRPIDYHRHTAALCLVTAMTQLAMVLLPSLLTLAIAQAMLGALTPVASMLTHRVQSVFDHADDARGGRFAGDRQALVQTIGLVLLIPAIGALVFAGDATPLDEQWRSINVMVATALCVVAVILLPWRTGRQADAGGPEERIELRALLAEPEFRRGFILYGLGQFAYGTVGALLPVVTEHYRIGELWPWLPGDVWLTWSVVALWPLVEFVQRLATIGPIRSTGRAFDNGTEGAASKRSTTHIAVWSFVIFVLAIYTIDSVAVFLALAAWVWLGCWGAGPAITAGRAAANRVRDPSASSIVSLGGWTLGLVGRGLVWVIHEPETLADPVVWAPCLVLALIALGGGIIAAARPSPHRPPPVRGGQSAL